MPVRCGSNDPHYKNIFIQLVNLYVSALLAKPVYLCLVPPGSTCLLSRSPRSEKGEATREARGAQQVYLYARAAQNSDGRQGARQGARSASHRVMQA